MKEIQFTYQGRNHTVIVDDDCYDALNTHQWHGFESGGYLYCARFSGDFRKPVWMLHWDVVGKPSKGNHIDHHNGNTLDCRHDNLRVCSHKENIRNSKRSKNNTSGFKGVYFHRGTSKWVARIKVDYKLIWLGGFDDPESAARAYDEAAKQHFGEFARLNFPR